MTIKQLTNRFNIKMYSVILALMIVTIALVCAFFFKVIEPMLYDSDMLVSEDFIVMDILSKVDTERIYDEEYQQELITQMDSFGYSLNVELNKAVVFSTFKEDDHEAIADTERQNEIMGVQPVIYQRMGTTVVQQAVRDSEGNEFVCSAVEYSMFNILGFSSNSFYLLLFVCIVIAILILTAATAVVNSVFSRGLVRKLSTPIKLLSSAASRVADDDYTKNIEYKGIDEFEDVCTVFNQMQQTLLENKSMAETYARTRNELIAGISHDIKTPLTGIRGYVKGILDGVANTPEKQEHYLYVISDKTRDIEKMIEMLILLSKLELNAVPLEKETISINGYLSEFVESFNDAGDAPCDIEFTANDEMDVDIDVMQMNRTLTNIINNSIKYADADKLVITINAYKEGRFAVLDIKDNGKGVDEKRLNQIFESFYRCDESRSTTTRGNGLGLAISKGIVELHGGSIRAENDNGLLIRIKLPLNQ